MNWSSAVQRTSSVVSSPQPIGGKILAISYDKTKTAVLIMDFQSDIVTNYAINDPDITARAASVLAAARSAGILVVHIVVSFRSGHPEIAPRGNFKAMKASGRFVQGTPQAAIHPNVEPHPGDVVVTKRRVGAFSGSDLDIILRAHGTEHLIIMGIATSGVVLTTVRVAADLDFEMTVIADCCADQDQEVHRVLTEKVFARAATISTSEEIIADLTLSHS